MFVDFRKNRTITLSTMSMFADCVVEWSRCFVGQPRSERYLCCSCILRYLRGFVWGHAGPCTVKVYLHRSRGKAGFYFRIECEKSHKPGFIVHNFHNFWLGNFNTRCTFLATSDSPKDMNPPRTLKRYMRYSSWMFRSLLIFYSFVNNSSQGRGRQSQHLATLISCYISSYTRTKPVLYTASEGCF